MLKYHANIWFVFCSFYVNINVSRLFRYNKNIFWARYRFSIKRKKLWFLNNIVDNNLNSDEIIIIKINLVFAKKCLIKFIRDFELIKISQNLLTSFRKIWYYLYLCLRKCLYEVFLTMSLFIIYRDDLNLKKTYFLFNLTFK